MMTKQQKVWWLLAACGGIFLAPYLGLIIKCRGNFPDGYFDFPPLSSPEKAPFNLLYFIILSAACLVMVSFYVFPRLWKFKKVPYTPVEYKFKFCFPLWFYIGLILFGGTLFVLWMKFSEPTWIINWAVIPLFWGFTLVLDGIVYVRTAGKSIISDTPQKIIGIGVASIAGWMIFEYLNFFVQDSWIYPEGGRIKPEQFLLYAFLGSSGLLPMAFEWYSLLNTFKKFRNRYVSGPKFTWLTPKRQTWLLVIAYAGLGYISFEPDRMSVSGMLWFAPMIILAIVLTKIGVWTPFTPVRNGNWAPLLLFALTYFIQGTMCELWNYYSAEHINGAIITVNPDYWVYKIPYVDILHVFEMPLLGLFGYLPFGIYCAIWWLTFCYLMDIPSHIHPNEERPE